MNAPFADLAARVRGAATPRIEGRVQNAAGLLIEATLPAAAIGEVCEIGAIGSGRLAEVVGLRDSTALLVPLGTSTGLRSGDIVRRLFEQTVAAGDGLLGRVIDALGEPLDGKPSPRCTATMPLYREPLSPMARGSVNTPFSLGLRAVDGFLTLARGMRMGIFAAAGVGKSTFVGAALRNTRAAVNVVALVGERGREVSEFVQHILGEDGMRRSVIVVATSDRSPLERVRAAFSATAIAEHFRDRGEDVLLVLDSLTRFGMAQREIGLAIGEPSTTKGYTPSVFALLPKLLERVCPSQHGGSITGIYTVLVEGDDMNDPLADAARGLLDGHIVLSRQLATRGHYPAIDVLRSISRVMDATVTREHARAANDLREVMANAAEAQELMDFGAYTPGKNARFDKALERMQGINAFLRQSPKDATPIQQTIAQLTMLGAHS
ncbi:MAG: FliI/YscN family ATPase [Deltaproteobacteria bacterium]|nr:FliI/YscN family ATPase [Deltaproteobacteria bacterium]